MKGKREVHSDEVNSSDQVCGQTARDKRVEENSPLGLEKLSSRPFGIESNQKGVAGLVLSW